LFPKVLPDYKSKAFFETLTLIENFSMCCMRFWSRNTL